MAKTVNNEHLTASSNSIISVIMSLTEQTLTSNKTTLRTGTYKVKVFLIIRSQLTRGVDGWDTDA